MARTFRINMLLLLLGAVNVAATASMPISCNSGVMHGMSGTGTGYGVMGYGGGYAATYPGSYPYYQNPQYMYQWGRPTYPGWPQNVPQARGYYGGQPYGTCGVGAGSPGYGSQTGGGQVYNGSAVWPSAGQAGMPVYGGLPALPNVVMGDQGGIANTSVPGQTATTGIKCFKVMPDGQLVPIAPGDIAKESANAAAQRALELQRDIEATKASCSAKIQEEERELKEAKSQAAAGGAITPQTTAPVAPVLPTESVAPVKADVTYVDPNSV